MWEERAHRARRDIVDLAASGLGVSDLHAAAIRVVGATVDADLTCWATIDPDSLVISTMISGDTRIPAEYEPRLARAEYSVAEPHTFATLAKRNIPIARMSDLDERSRARSARLQNVWRPLGLERELRALFLTGRSCWGAAGMVRSGPDFTDRESEFLAGVAPAIAGATRLAMRTEAARHSGHGQPAIVVIGADGEQRAATSAAQEWRDRLDEVAPGRFAVMMQIMASGAVARSSGTFEARVRDRQGRWVMLRASPLIGDADEEVAVDIQSATGDQLMALLLTAYGLTSRERDICREVIAGHSTTEIADRLYISNNTVQDHLKSIFVKVAVRSRGELVARLVRPG